MRPVSREFPAKAVNLERLVHKVSEDRWAPVDHLEKPAHRVFPENQVLKDSKDTKVTKAMAEAMVKLAHLVKKALLVKKVLVEKPVCLVNAVIQVDVVKTASGDHAVHWASPVFLENADQSVHADHAAKVALPDQWEWQDRPGRIQIPTK